MRFDIRSQIVTLSVCGGLLIVLALTLTQSTFAVYDVRQRIQRSVEDIAQTVRQTNIPLTLGTLRQIRGLSGFDFIRLLDSGEAVAASTVQLDGQATLREYLDASKRPDSLQSQFDFARPLEVANAQYFVARIERDGERLLVLQPAAEYRRRVWLAAFRPAVTGLLACLAILLVGLFTANRIARKLKVVRDQMDRVARGEFQTIEVPRTDDEVRDLSLAANNMSLQLQQYEREIRTAERFRMLEQVGRALAHEIRNAATGAKLALDLHQRKLTAEPANSMAADENLGIVRHQLAGMEQCVNRFLAGEAERDAELFDLALSVQSVVNLVEPLARHLGVQVEIQTVDKPQVQLNRLEFEQVLSSLLNNGLQAASAPQPDGKGAAQLIVRIANVDKWAQIRVSDSGPGPNSAISEQMFEPFNTDKPDGMGLGLYLARRSAVRWGGQIDFSRESGMTHFCIRIPQDPASTPAEVNLGGTDRN